MSFQEIQKNIAELFFRIDAPVSEYLNAAKSLKGLEPPEYFRKINIAILSNFTLQGLPEVLSVCGVFHNLLLKTYLAPYDQYMQEILNPVSELYEFAPDIAYLIIDVTSNEVKQSVKDAVDGLLLNTPAKIIVISNSEFGKKDTTHTVFFDLAGWLKTSGHKKDWYTKYKDMADLRLAPDAFPDLSEALLGYAVAVAGAGRKCIVTDLDNTMWKGIVSEDGIENISPNKKYQEILLELYKKGIILAINSANNEADALSAIESLPGMILKKEHFAAWRINWESKAENMVELAKELNLGLDSFVFIDDDAFQQNLVRESLLQVAVLPFSDSDIFLEILKNFAGFSSSALTDEDLKRGQMYTEERKRKEFEGGFKTLEDFLKELNLKVEIFDVDEKTLPRASQMTLKTNQFNQNKRPYSESTLKYNLKKGWKIWLARAQDRFGDYGIIGLIMVEPKEETRLGEKKKTWLIDNFLLSCRILGKGAEKKIIDYLLKEAKKADVKTIEGVWRATEKNWIGEEQWIKIHEAEDRFWENHGFKYTGFARTSVESRIIDSTRYYSYAVK